VISRTTTADTTVIPPLNDAFTWPQYTRGYID
jgi:hypothetical protein